MKKLFTTVAIFAALSSMSAQGFMPNLNANTGDRVVGHDQVLAVVEDTTITRDDIMRAMAPFVQKLRDESRNQQDFDRKFEQLSKEMLQELVDKVIIVKEFNSKGYMIPQTVFDAQFEDDIKRNFNGDRSEFLKYLQSQNKTIKQYRKEQEENMIVGQMRYMQRKSASEISPAHIQKYYDDNKQKWYLPERIKFRQITLKDESPDALKEAAQKIYAEIKNGMEFGAAAKIYSKDEYAKNEGVAGSWYTKGQFSPEIENVLFALEPGKMSEPLVIGTYAFIWKLEEKKPDGIQSLEDVIDLIENTISNDNANIEYHKWLDRIRKKAYIRYY